MSLVKKGRHRRYEEARALKRSTDEFDEILGADEPCIECGALPGEEAKSWCASKSCPGKRESEEESLFPS